MFLPALLVPPAALACYRRLPASWLCEYGELPGEQHRPACRCPRPGRTLAVLWPLSTSLFRAAGRLTPARGALLSAAMIILIIAALSDLDYRIIPDQAALAMLAPGLLAARFLPGAGFDGFLRGGLLVLGMMLLSAALGRVVSRQECIGTGDIKLMSACGASLGALFGPEAVPAALSFFSMSVLSAAGFFALLLLFRRSSYGDARPMAPWIALSALCCMAAGLRQGL